MCSVYCCKGRVVHLLHYFPQQLGVSLVSGPGVAYCVVLYIERSGHVFGSPKKLNERTGCSGGVGKPMYACMYLVESCGRVLQCPS